MSEIEILKEKIPLNSLAPPNLQALLEKAVIQPLKAGATIFEQGDTDKDAVYLLEGEVELVAADGSTRRISADGEQAAYALAQLRPRQYTGRAAQDSRIARVDGEQLDRLLAMDQLSGAWASADGIEVGELEIEGDNDWMMQMLRSPAFEKLPIENVSALLSKMQSREVKSGEVVIKQGDMGDAYYVIKEGRFTVARKEQGKVKILAELGVGDVFGEESLLAHAPRNASVIAMSEGELMRVDKEDFDALLKAPLVGSVGPGEAEAMLKQGAGLLDVRTPEEYRQAALRRARNLPLNRLRGALPALPADRPYVLCCDTGARSAVAAFLMSQRGFEVRVLAGGLQALSQWPGAPEPGE